MARPEWNKPETYPGTPDDWTFSRWAWEFLRRNKNFQADSEAVKDASETDRRKMARKYGLAEYKHYKEAHVTPTSCLWVAEAIFKYKAATEDGTEVRFTLQKNEVALVFDLNHIQHVGKSALEAQLYAARSVLDEYLADFSITVPDVRVSRRGFFELLRVYDGMEVDGATLTEVARVLKPEDFGNGDNDKETDARKRIHDLRRRAQELVENGYRNVATRDYLQDRAKKHSRPAEDV